MVGKQAHRARDAIGQTINEDKKKIRPKVWRFLGIARRDMAGVSVLLTKQRLIRLVWKA